MMLVAKFGKMEASQFRAGGSPEIVKVGARNWRLSPFFRTLLALLIASAAMAQATSDVIEVFRLAGEALANQDAKAFLGLFDEKMAGYGALRDQVQELLAVDGVASTVDVVTNEGDDKMRVFSLDWVLRIGSDRPRRQIVKCTVEKLGKSWKITGLEPVEFFKK